MSQPAAALGGYVVLSGGSGGVKLAVGLAQVLRERLAVVVNTGDDFVHVGLHISPDVDTVLYSLAGVINGETGWGRRGEGRRDPDSAGSQSSFPCRQTRRHAQRRARGLCRLEHND